MKFERKTFIAGGPDGTTIETSTVESKPTGKTFYADPEGTVHTDKKIETKEERNRKIKEKLAELKGVKNLEEAIGKPVERQKHP